MSEILIESAPPEQMVDACRLLFQRYPPEEALNRLSNALGALERGDLNPAGILVARDAMGLLGVLACLPLPGASALLWPPQLAPCTAGEVPDRLIQYALAFLHKGGSKIVQTLLTPEEAPQATPLLRHGFQLLTTLDFLRHALAQKADAPERLTYHCYDAWTAGQFQETLLRTYEDGLDCPELNRRRDVRDIIAGHQAQGRYDPGRWWLAQEQGRPVGVLLLNEIPEWRSMDVAYLGIVPEARGRGFGRELTCRALRTARAADLQQVTLTVDRRNVPARNLYTRLGFEWFDEREVYLTFLSCPADGS